MTIINKHHSKWPYFKEYGHLFLGLRFLVLSLIECPRLEKKERKKEKYFQEQHVSAWYFKKNIAWEKMGICLSFPYKLHGFVPQVKTDNAVSHSKMPIIKYNLCMNWNVNLIVTSARQSCNETKTLLSNFNLQQNFNLLNKLMMTDKKDDWNVTIPHVIRGHKCFAY